MEKNTFKRQDGRDFFDGLDRLVQKYKKQGASLPQAISFLEYFSPLLILHSSFIILSEIYISISVISSNRLSNSFLEYSLFLALFALLFSAEEAETLKDNLKILASSNVFIPAL